MIALLVALLLGSPSPAHCKGAANLQANARVTCDAARASALQKLGGKGLQVQHETAAREKKEED